MLEKTWQSHNYIKVCIYTKNSQANVSKGWQKKQSGTCIQRLAETVGNMYPKIGRNSQKHVSKCWQKQSGTCIQRLAKTVGNMYSKDWLKQSGTCIQKLAKTVGNMYPVVG